MRPETLLLAGRKRSKRTGAWNVTACFSANGIVVSPGLTAVARVFDLCNRRLVARVDNLHAAHFFIGLAGFFQQLPLPGNISYSFTSRSARTISYSAPAVYPVPSQIDQIATRELRRGRRLQPTRDEVCIRQDLFADEASAIQIGIGGRRNALDRKAGRGRRRSLRSSRAAAPSAPVCAQAAVASNNTNSPVFFMLPPGRTASRASPQLNARKERLQPEGNKRVRVGSRLRGCWAPWGRSFSSRIRNPLLHN